MSIYQGACLSHEWAVSVSDLVRVAHREAQGLWFLRAYAWPLYDYAKHLVDSHEKGSLFAASFSGQLSACMRESAKIGEPLRVDMAFTQMCRIAAAAAKDWREFLGFAYWAGVDDFSDDDRKPYVNEQGKTLDSVPTRFTRAICRETASSASSPSLPLA